MFQLILNPTRDWNLNNLTDDELNAIPFQLILNPTRDWNAIQNLLPERPTTVPINLKPY